MPWDARSARHLFGRAGFGIPESELAAVVARSPEEVVDELLDAESTVEPFLARRYALRHDPRARNATPEELEKLKLRIRSEERRHAREYAAWWMERILDGSDPLRDRMTLFWHGFFTTDARTLRRNYEAVNQHQLLRENALGSYATMLAGIVRDPAMLYYLDNTSNQSGSPNENFARELMELFSLGEGNYSEQDVLEVARALTGYTADRDGNFVFQKRRHDAGEKQILGEVGTFDGAAVVLILLRQEACARWVSRRVITYLEGVEPDPERIERYADLLRSGGYELRPFLRALLLDPAFYRPEVVGTRVMGPVDYVAISARRLGLDVPGRFLYEAAGTLGQRVFEPPNVKGWDEGEAWITSASLLQRGNVAGLMLGVLDLEGSAPASPAQARAGAPGRSRDARMDDASMDSSMMSESDAMMDATMDAELEEGGPSDGSKPRMLRTLQRALGDALRPNVNLSWRMQQAGAEKDGAMVDRLLADTLSIEPTPGAREVLLQFLRSEREAYEVKNGKLLEEPELCESILRRLVHLLLSLPEAQLG